MYREEANLLPVTLGNCACVVRSKCPPENLLKRFHVTCAHLYIKVIYFDVLPIIVCASIIDCLKLSLSLYLQGSLPLMVIFDVSEDSSRIDNDMATHLMQKHNVYINIRRKPKLGIASIIIKGIERCAGKLDLYPRVDLGFTEVYQVK